MAEPLQENPPTDVQDDDERSEILSHGPSAPPDSETESKLETHPDLEAQSMVIESLRSQIQDLFSQVTQLNGKLVSSYDRVSVLEDQLHDSSNELRLASVKVSQLELERSQHLSALNSGLLVERAHVTAELTRVMEKATEEAARRGKAESARAQIEKELDDLSAGLFGQANTMVAEARLQRAASERKVEETERALKGTEEAIANMQLHMQALDEEKKEALRQVEEMRVTVGKGKWTSKDSSTSVTIPRHVHILNCTSQYQDFLGFVAHIRELRQKSPILPLINTVNHPWLARLQLEDSDPTVRLELSSSINWMNRRSVLLAIQQGQLDIEPVSSETFLQEHAAAQSGISGLGTGSSIICGLCGAFIMNDSKSSSGVFQRQLTLPTNPWSTSLFASRQTSRSATPLQSPGIPKPATIYIFRLAVDPYGTPQPGRSRPTYPLCTSGWCLNRLRTACNLWAFVRTSIMEKLWEEANLVASRRTSTGETPSQSESENQQENTAPPPPAAPLRGRFGKLWERASSLGAGVVEKVSTTGPEKDRKNEEDARKLPSPPPEPEETPPTRPVPPLPLARTQVPVPPQLPPRNKSRETTAPPVEEASPPRRNSVLFEHDQHDHPQPVESPPVQRTPPIEPSEPEKLESVVDIPKPPVLPPRASRHSPADIVRPGTPSATPLPDSRPSTPTPTTAERNRSVPSTPTKLDPGRSSSPVPRLVGTPPPIPRRAPARVRPVSVAMRPPTPLNQPPLNPPEEEKAEAKVPGVDLPTTIDEFAKPVDEVVPPAVAEVISRPEVIESIFTEVEPRRLDTEVTRTTEASDPITLTRGFSTSPVDDVSHTIGDNRDIINDQNLVGEKSWEDKIWREVVRLREEMFCARMGIIQ